MFQEHKSVPKVSFDLSKSLAVIPFVPREAVASVRSNDHWYVCSFLSSQRLVSSKVHSIYFLVVFEIRMPK